MKKEGEARGVIFETDSEFLRGREGKEAVRRAEKKLEEAGVDFRYRSIESMEFYPIGLRALSLLAAGEVLGLGREGLEEVGEEAPKSSFLVKMFFKFFFSVDKTLAQAPRMWRKHYTVGRLESEGGEEEREIIIRITDFDIHPALCPYLQGYFSTIMRMIINEETEGERVRCGFEGGPKGTHEYRFVW